MGVRFEQRQHDALTRLAEDRGVPVSQLLREAAGVLLTTAAGR